MTVNQISIFLENKYGKLSEILALLAEENIRIIAATVADTSEYGILRIIVSDPQKAYKILKSNNVSAFGIEDPGIWLAYLLAFACLIFSLWFGITNWNKGDKESDNPKQPDK